MIHTVFSTWKFTTFNFPYFSFFLHLVPNKKTRRSIWSSYVRTWNAWLKSKVRLQMRSFAIFDLSSIMWWVMFFTFSAGSKKTKEHRARMKNVLDLILKLANMAWMANFIKSKKRAVNLNLNASGSLHIIWLCILRWVCHRSFWLY